MYQAYVQRNVIGQDFGLPYPKNVEHVPYGPEFDTEDAAKLFASSKGWMRLWWSIGPVARPPHSAGGSNGTV